MEVGIVQGGVRARVVERQIVRHLTHLIPYLTPSPVTTLIHPFLRYAFLQPDPLTLHTPFSPEPPRLACLFIVLFLLFLVLFSPLPLPPSSPVLSLDSPRRFQSFRLPTPYKRSCCPFITTTPATTTTERPTAPTSFPALPFILHRFPPFVPPPCFLPPSTCTARVFPSFLRSVLKHRCNPY